MAEAGPGREREQKPHESNSDDAPRSLEEVGGARDTAHGGRRPEVGLTRRHLSARIARAPRIGGDPGSAPRARTDSQPGRRARAERDPDERTRKPKAPMLR